MKAVITVGVSASGKTTWARQRAKETGALITNRDDIRFSLTGACGWHEYRFNRRVEAIITGVQWRILESNAATIRRDIIIADTNLHAGRRQGLIQRCEALGYKVVVMPFPIALDHAIRRDSMRGLMRVGAAVIEQQFKQYTEFLKETSE